MKNLLLLMVKILAAINGTILDNELKMIADKAAAEKAAFAKKKADDAQEKKR